MSDAAFIVVCGRRAGVAVRIGAKTFRFFSTMREAYPLEDRTFRSRSEIVKAVQDLLGEQRRLWL